MRLTLFPLLLLPFAMSCSMPASERAALVRDITGVVGNIGPMVSALLADSGKIDADTNRLVSEALKAVRDVGAGVAALDEAGEDEVARDRALADLLAKLGSSSEATGGAVVELLASRGKMTEDEAEVWKAVTGSLAEAGEVGAGGITGQGTTADILTAALLAIGAGAGGKVLGHKAEAKRTATTA